MFGRKIQKSLNKVRDATRQKSDLEQHLRQALSKENWMAPNSLLQEIALQTEEDEDRALVLRHIWDILDNGSAYWRRILKALALVEVLLKRGSVKMIQDIKKDSWKIAKWREHRVMEQGTDVGSGMREKAKNILEFLEDPEELNRQRQKNHELYSKMAAVGNAPEQRERKSMSQHIHKAMDRATGGKRAQQDAFQSEISVQQKRAQEHIAVQEFMAVSGASEREACRYLHLSHGDLRLALEEYRRMRSKRPSPSALREMCQQVMTIAAVSEKRATQLLEQSSWDVAEAIDKALSSGGGSVQERSTTASSDSDSDSSDSESDFDHSGSRGNTQAWQSSSPPSFGATQRSASPRSNGAFGQQHGAPSNGNSWPTPSGGSSPWGNNAMAQQYQSPYQSPSSSPRGSPWGNDAIAQQYQPPAGKGGWPPQPGNPFGGKGYGKGGPSEGFNGQQASSQLGGKGAAFGQQFAGGKGGYSNNPFGGSNTNSTGQQGGFGGPNNPFGGQKGAFNGQMAGFSPQQSFRQVGHPQQQWSGFSQGGQGFGAKGGHFTNNSSANNPFGNW